MPCTFESVTQEMLALHHKKQEDYGLDADPYFNVRQGEGFGVTPWLASILRANDKMTRLKRYAQRGTLANESVEDSLLDLANYAVIALVLFRQYFGNPQPSCTCNGPAGQPHQTHCPYYQSPSREEADALAADKTLSHTTSPDGVRFSLLQSQYNALSTQLRNAHRQITADQEEKSRLRHRMETAEKAYAALLQLKEDILKDATRLREERNQKDAELESVRATREQCLQTIEHFKKKCEELQKDIEELKSYRESDARIIDGVRTERDELRRAIKYMEKRLTQDTPSPRLAAWLETQQRDEQARQKAAHAEGDDQTRTSGFAHQNGWNAAFEHLIGLCLNPS